MSLSSTYLSVKELLANNLTSKGVNANKNEGLTTLANKILDISDFDNLNYEKDSKATIFGTSDDIEAVYSIEDITDIEEYINDAANGTPVYSLETLSNGQQAIKRTTNGWSRHSILRFSDILSYLSNQQSSFYIEGNFYTQDGFETPGLFISDETNPNDEKFYQIYMFHNGGYYEGFDETGANARTRWIKIGSEKNILNTQGIYSQVIKKHYMHTFRIFYLQDTLILEFYGQNQNFEQESRCIYQIPISNFTPTSAGLVLGYLGSKDRKGNNIVFNNVNVVELL